MQKLHALDIPPVWTLAAWVAAALLARVMPDPGWTSLGLRWLGLFWIVLALLFVLWSAWLFRRQGTPIHPGHTPKALIVRGPYRMTRNPIYLAMVFATLGFGLWLGAFVALLPAVGLWYALDRRFVRPEEDRLRQTFGARAETYFNTTRRWI